MHVNNILASLILFAIALSSAARADTELPPLDHSIYATPSVLERIALTRQLRWAYPGGPPGLLEWQVALDQEEYVVGEPISGVLAVTNSKSNQRDNAAIHYRMTRLFDLSNDLSQQTDLAAKDPEKIDELTELLRQIRQGD